MISLDYPPVVYIYRIWAFYAAPMVLLCGDFPMNLSQLIIFTWCLLPRELEAESWVLLLLFRADRPELRMRFAQNLEPVILIHSGLQYTGSYYRSSVASSGNGSHYG